jgi:hypothetical protein
VIKQISSRDILLHGSIHNFSCVYIKHYLNKTSYRNAICL